MDKSVSNLHYKSPLHKKVVEALDKRYQLSARRMQSLHKEWMRAEDSFVAYLPAKAIDKKKDSLRENTGQQDYTTIVLPYTYSMLMSAHSYWTSVFLGRAPIFQFSGRHGEAEQQTQALEALIAYQIQVGRHMLPYYFWLLDAGKFGFGVLGEYWCEEVSYISRNQDTPRSFLGIPLLGTKSEVVTETVRSYYGTKVFNVRPYDWFPDPRVPLWDLQRGEFNGYHSEVGWNEILVRAQSGEYIKENCNALKKKLFDGGAQQGATGRVEGSPRANLPNSSEDTLLLGDIADTGPYGLLTIYVNLVPSEWGLGDRSHPEKWVFTVATNGRSAAVPGTLKVILGAKPLGAYHNKFPFAIIQMEPDAYALTTRGVPEISKAIQQAMDWLLNSHMYNVRNALNNQFLLDPGRVVMSDFRNPLPGGGIRLKQAAWGTDPRTVMAQLPVQDVTRQHLMDMQYLDQFAQKALGINEQIMGQINTGGRKTAAEIRTSSTFGVNRQKTISEFYSAAGFDPLAELLVQDSQQWYDAGMKLRAVGDLAQLAGPKFLEVNPEAIQGFFDFIPVDGTLPVDRFAQANLWKEILVGMKQMPEIAMQYDLARIFAWTAQLAGLKNINQMRVQSAPPGAVQQQAQAGNLVPLPQKRNLAEPGQIPNLGPTA